LGKDPTITTTATGSGSKYYNAEHEEIFHPRPQILLSKTDSSNSHSNTSNAVAGGGYLGIPDGCYHVSVTYHYPTKERFGFWISQMSTTSKSGTMKNESILLNYTPKCIMVARNISTFMDR
jgi:hypothetical protein